MDSLLIGPHQRPRWLRGIATTSIALLVFLLLQSGEAAAQDVGISEEDLLSWGSAVVGCVGGGFPNPIAITSCFVSKGIDAVVLRRKLEEFKLETTSAMQRAVAQAVQEALQAPRLHPDETRLLADRVNRQLLDYANELLEIRRREGVTSRRIEELERQIGELKARLEPAESSMSGPRTLFIYGAALGEALVSTENGRAESSESRIVPGWRVGVGGQGAKAFWLDFERRSSVEYRAPATGDVYGSFERDRAQFVVDLSTSDARPGLGFRLGGEYRAGRFRLAAGDEPPRESRAYLGGVGLSFGGMNRSRSVGAAATADWRWGKSHIDLIKDGLRSTEVANIRSQRYEVWAVAGRAYLMFEARVFLDIIDQSLPAEIDETGWLPPWLRNDPPPLWAAQEISGGASVGIRLLFK